MAWNWHQRLLAFAVMGLGLYVTSIMMQRAFPNPQPPAGVQEERLADTSIDDLIIGKAKEARLVMFGENHYVLEDDRYVASLLSRLKQEAGYTHLAIEAPRCLQPQLDTSLESSQGGNNTHFIGLRNDISPYSYSEFAISRQLVVQAHDAGYNIFLYDSQGICGNPEKEPQRDRRAFAFLQERLSPQDKAVVFCGADHLAKQPILENGRPIRYLASHLQSFTKGKTLTVALLQSSDVEQISHGQDILLLFSHGERKYILSSSP